MVVLAFLTDPDVIHKILKHLELPTASPPLLPDRCAVEEFDQCIDLFASDDGQYADHVSPGHNRCQRPRPARPFPLNRAGGPANDLKATVNPERRSGKNSPTHSSPIAPPAFTG